MKKQFMILIFVLLSAAALSAQGAKKVEMYVAPTFGMGFNFDSYNAIGLLAGVDVIFKVWENRKKAPGKMFAGVDTGFEYWIPTRSTGFYTNYKSHYLDWPVAGYFSYEFKVDAGPLAYAGPFFTAGVGFAVVIDDWDSRAVDNKTDFFVVYSGAFGGHLVFKNNWALKQSFTWGAGALGWGSFNLEAEYRF
jgi:hypothetical protein